jgi:hypothetical protein
MYHSQPLLPGQAFSFVKPCGVKLYQGEGEPVYMPTHVCESEVSILPSARLTVHDEVYFGMDGMWHVRSWMHGRPLTFRQQCGEGALIALLEGSGLAPYVATDREQDRIGWAVTDVDWPEPTPESLMVQVRVLGCYTDPLRPSVVRTFPRPLRWDQCQQLKDMELSDGLRLALDWLSPYVADPAAALRERGFAM